MTQRLDSMRTACHRFKKSKLQFTYLNKLTTIPFHSTMECFRWRLADDCGPDHDTLKCDLRHRTELDQTLIVTSQGSSVTFRSPGFDRRNPGYKNRNLCIYNISLNCDGNAAELEPSTQTTSLSDGDTCQDYLSFHMDSQRQPLMKLCGDDVKDQTKYRTIYSTSFYGVLWSNNNKSESGRFEITATCKDIPGSEDDTSNETVLPFQN